WLEMHGGEEHPSGQGMAVRVLLARSLERSGDWTEAVRLLDTVLNTPVDPEHRLRLGMTTRDPSVEALELHRRFRQELLTTPPGTGGSDPSGD
ncbi:MAG: tetratricopeptide repeat-containing protein, partial [Candidatus Sumerlaeia bacterium]|nr:tetratricopeptide repeat-containing protein [Candidatus Sumerlaeia bacterium]